MAETKQRQTGIAEVNGTSLYYEVEGEGHPFVMVHGGLVDRRLWDEQFDVFAQHYKMIRFDMRGFGDSGLYKADMAPFRLDDDLYELLRFLGIEKTYVMGLSMGGAVAIDFTLAHPEMVDALIPVAMGLGGFEGDDSNKPLWMAIEAAFKEGDFEKAAELSTRMWTDGPVRTSDQVDPAVRERVKAMTLHNYQRPDDNDAPDPQELEPPAAQRLAEIRVPTLIIVGDADVREILTIADTLVAGVKGAKKEVIPNTAHHLNMEKPEEFNSIVLNFLGTLQ
ncbi:MAG TPA: alpha/beta hydrolase [Ktedonobacteraceae bacterium]|nr:alpha/beta hydrolase [Ktedonobacteraceae bacterium]